jgi:hypothetical protein
MVRSGASVVRESGITLIETAIGLTVLLIVLVASVGSVRVFLGQRTLGGWGDVIVSDIRAAQQLGIAQRAPVIMTFVARTSTSPAAYVTTVGGTALRRETLPPELNITSTTFQFDTLEMPAGSKAISLTLSDSRVNYTTTITVIPVTGAVMVQ